MDEVPVWLKPRKGLGWIAGGLFDKRLTAGDIELDAPAQ